MMNIQFQNFFAMNADHAMSSMSGMSSPQMNIPLFDLSKIDFKALASTQLSMFNNMGSNNAWFPAGKETPKVNLDKQFLEKVKAIASKVGCDYKDLLAIMNSESGLNSKAVNKKGGATGLIQFMPETAKALGTTTERLYNMSPMEQLDYVEKYLTNAKSSAGMNGRNLSGGDLYSLVFLPAKANKEVLCDFSTKAYQWNKGLDINKDGQITKTEMGQFVRKKQVNESIFS